MAKITDKGLKVSIEAVIRYVGGLSAMIEEIGLKNIIDAVGLKRIADEVGWERVIEELGPEILRKALPKMDPDDLWDHLTAEQKRALKKRLS
ncbi:MAG: hypothetical protein L0Z62_42400 [Gemmataceae bacterium]|nr:hypothetical protein [Gemmataceae bacterium]